MLSLGTALKAPQMAAVGLTVVQTAEAEQAPRCVTVTQPYCHSGFSMQSGTACPSIIGVRAAPPALPSFFFLILPPKHESDSRQPSPPPAPARARRVQSDLRGEAVGVGFVRAAPGCAPDVALLATIPSSKEGPPLMLLSSVEPHSAL